MRARRRGALVHVASIAASRAAAVLRRLQPVEGRGRDAVAPARLRVGAGRRAVELGQPGHDPDALVARASTRCPASSRRARRWCRPAASATPEDIADVAAFLASPRAAYVTGQDIVVDGGFSQTLMAHRPASGPRGDERERRPRHRRRRRHRLGDRPRLRRRAATGSRSSTSTAARPRRAPPSSGAGHLGLGGDVTDEASVRAAVDRAEDALRRPRRWWSTTPASATIRRATLDQDIGRFRRVLSVHLDGTFLVSREAARHMLPRRPRRHRQRRLDRGARRHPAPQRLRRAPRPGSWR